MKQQQNQSNFCNNFFRLFVNSTRHGCPGRKGSPASAPAFFFVGGRHQNLMKKGNIQNNNTKIQSHLNKYSSILNTTAVKIASNGLNVNL
jgi:hypothetical protein